MQLSNNPSNKISEMVTRRLKGESVSDIANDLGVSRQYVYSVLSKIPKGDYASINVPRLPLSQERKIVMSYLELVPRPSYLKKYGSERFLAESVRILSSDFSQPEEVIKATLYRVTAYHPSVADSPYYATLQKWRASNAVNLNELASYGGISVARMRDILRGWRHMPLSVALGISEHTGLTVEEIYGDLLKLDAKLGEEVEA